MKYLEKFSVHYVLPVAIFLVCTNALAQIQTPAVILTKPFLDPPARSSTYVAPNLPLEFKKDSPTRPEYQRWMDEKNKTQILLLQPPTSINFVIDDPDEVRRFMRVKGDFFTRKVTKSYIDPKTRERKQKVIDEPVTFHGENLMKFKLCPYQYDELGKVDETQPCKDLEGGKYYSVYSLDSPRRVAEFNHQASTVLYYTALAVVSYYTGGLATEAFAIRFGLQETIGTTANLINVSRGASLVKKAVWTAAFSLPIYGLANDATITSLDIVGLDGTEFLDVLHKYHFTDQGDWKDKINVLVYDNDVYLTQFRKLIHSMVATSHYKQHDEICKDCMIHCVTAAERESQKMVNYVGGLSPGFTSSSNQDDFYLCDE